MHGDDSPVLTKQQPRQKCQIDQVYYWYEVMATKIKYSRDALKYLDTQTKKSVERIRAAISKLTKSSPEGDIAPMQGYSDGRMRLRIGSWRVVFNYTTVDQIKMLLIIDIGSRGDIYK